jgi:putative aldouronate transport system permease protein
MLIKKKETYISISQNKLLKRVILHKSVYLMLLPAFFAVLIFSYFPMYGILVAFKNYSPFLGIENSPWAANLGFEHFINIFKIPEISQSIINTLNLSVLTLIVGFPAPIILALLFNELRVGKFKKTLQTISYLPHFLSMMAIIGITQTFLASEGTLNDLLHFILGPNFKSIRFLAVQEMFVPNILFITVWKNIGWGSIIYLATISGIDASLYEAARIDGANRFKQVLHITIPSIVPTAMILLILNMGSLFSSNFELVFGLQNVNIRFDTIDTIVYKYGIGNSSFSAATAIGLLQGLVALILVSSANFISKKVSNTALW